MTPITEAGYQRLDNLHRRTMGLDGDPFLEAVTEFCREFKAITGEGVVTVYVRRMARLAVEAEQAEVE